MTRLPLDALVAQLADRPVALLNLARTLLAKGRNEKAHELALKARQAGADDPEVLARAAEILSNRVPQWHFAIVRDAVRNDAYEQALVRAITPTSRVLDIGSGTGLLAMMAARAGAARVFTCEMNGAVAAAARSVIAHNGLSERITVLSRHSDDIDAERDMGGPVDILVSEIVSNNMLGEATLPVHEKAVRRLLRPGGHVIPARGRVRVALARYDRSRRMTSAAGFDLSPFNVLQAPLKTVSVDSADLALCSDAADLFDFDFASGGPFPEARAQVPVTASANDANGIAQWLALDMDGTGVYENRPGPGTASCWAAVFHHFPPGLTVAAGTRIAIAGSHDRNSVTLWPKP
ncbi:50S ribosomal protein L11 methyltransferase [Zavarzinia sp. CC-PAN008]|uniref:50S ribosomal protein L11 methyltransferase n=1 Tax=Zavarzinia sp. CC-PAN008 TaxID=3243332 RepID=UPI003F7432F0